MTLPDDIYVPTVDELDAERERLELSKQEFARRAGFDEDRWSDITRRDIDPQLSTIHAFVDALREADPNGDRPRPGSTPPLRGDGGTTEADP